MRPAFEPVFQALRDILLRHAGGLVVVRDAPGDLIVHTPHGDPRGRPVWFGAVTIKKGYVAYHLPPLYDHPALADSLSPALVRRRQGKTCFNFRQVDAVALEELERLTSRIKEVICWE